MTKILVVDDISTNRILLKRTLKSFDNYDVVEAANGKEAISQFDKENPDLILMDIMMPEVDGCQAATAIKEKMGNDYTPIIFVTALSSDDSLAKALSSGGDDFISKPFNIDILESKINAHLRIRELNNQLAVKNKLLSQLNQNLIQEQELIEHFFERAIQQSFLDENIIKYHMSSMSSFNGDVLLTERAPHGGLYLILGDFTGHGLTAAMGTLPVAMIFFKMVAENFGVEDIARELNSQLYTLMPTNMFFVATILELNTEGNILSAWMGGMPDSYRLSKDGKLKDVIRSQHMPLGILDDTQFNSATQVFDIEPEDKVYLHSDGIVEAKNEKDELFGDDRLKDILVNEGNNRFEKVLTKLSDFTGKNKQNDDITFVELNCQKIPALEYSAKTVSQEDTLAWNISVTLTEKEMRTKDPVRKLSSILSSMPYISRHRGVLHVLLSEIYSNSLEHSILHIESIEKTDEEHFIEYYKKRDAALLKLGNASISFNFKFIINEKGNYLEIKTQDSGDGYKKASKISTDEMLHGRGLGIINSFSDKVSFSSDGKILTVLYKI